jgi:DHA2 family multidrug resistance protein
MSAPAAPATLPTSRPEHRGIITACVMMATLMQALDTTIANVALPYMQGTLSATSDQVNWVLTSYIVAAVIMTPATGFLSGVLGRRRFFLIAVAGFTFTSVLCGLAQSIEQMVLFRVLQGIFGAPLVPMSQNLILDSYPRERQPQAMAMWGMAVMLGPILGPTLGGWLTDAYSWRYVFYINLPIGIATFIGFSIYLFESPLKNIPFDWKGFLAFSIAIGALQMMLDRGEQLDWFSSPEIIGELLLAIVATYMFIVHSLTTEHPFIDLRMFKDRNLSLGLFCVFLVGIVLLASLALVTPFIQRLQGYPVVTAGLIMGPRGMGTMVAMVIVGRVGLKIDPRLQLVFGFGLIAGVMWHMTTYTADTPSFTIMRDGILQGFGLGFVFAPLSTLTFSTMPPQQRATGTALFALIRNLGSSIGTSVVVFLLARNTRIAYAEMNEAITPFNDALHVGAAAKYWDVTTAAGRAALTGVMTAQATLIGYVDDFLFVMVIALAAMPFIFLLRRPPVRGPVPQETVVAD